MSKKSISIDALKVVIGLCLILFSITSLINRGYFGGAFTYVIVWAFGFVGYWFIFPFIALIGIFLCFHKRLKKINFGISLIGLLIFIFSLLLFITNFSLTSNNLEVPYFNNFIDIFLTYFKATSFPTNTLEIRIGGGALGYFLCGAFNTLITPLAVNIISIVIGAIGVLFIFNFIFVLIFRAIKRKTNTKKAKKENKYRYFDDNRIFDTSEIENIMNQKSEDYSRVSSLHNNQEIKTNNVPATPIKDNVTPIVNNNQNVNNQPSQINNIKSNNSIKKAVFVDDDDLQSTTNNSNNELKNPVLDIDFSDNDVKDRQKIDNQIKEEEKPVEIKPNIDEISSNRVDENNTPEVAPIKEKIEPKKEEIIEEEKEEVIEDIVEVIEETKIETKPYVPPAHTNVDEEEEEEEIVDEEVVVTNNEEPIYVEQDGVTYRPQQKAKQKPEFKLPPLDLLNDPIIEDNTEENKANCEANVEKINAIFKNMNIGAEVVGFTIGPSVTQYDVFTNEQTPVEQILKAEKTICVRLNGKKVTINTIVEGKPTSEILVPNEKRSTVYFKDTFMALPPISKSSFYIPFGKNISGEFKAAKLTSFPHMLIAGTSGSGKSVYVNSILLSLIMRNSPDTLRLILIDPKRVEFSLYREIPHLLCPVITDSKKADLVLKKLSEEMERRYTLFEFSATSDIESFNDYAEEQGLEKLPYIVLVTDEFGDLVDTNKKVCEFVTKLAAKARAAGIHLIIATQRPSVDVIPGTIKANLNTRVCLSVSKSQDSQVILGCGGAENLLGYGDMIVDCGLISRNGLVRAQGCFVDKGEVKAVCKYFRDNYKVEYDPFFTNLKPIEEEKPHQEVPTLSLQEQRAKSDDELYNQIKDDVMRQQYTSVSKIQREYQIGFNRAGKMVNRLMRDGIIGEAESQSSNKGCPVLKHIDSSPSAGPGSKESSEVI